MFDKIFCAKRAVGVVFLFVFMWFTGCVFGYDGVLPQESQKQAVMTKVARDLIAVAEKQFQRGLYCHSEESLLRAENYSDYLSDTEWANARALLVKVHDLSVKRIEALKMLESAEDYIAKGDLFSAKDKLEIVIKSEYLLAEEKEIAAERLREVENQINASPHTAEDTAGELNFLPKEQVDSEQVGGVIEDIAKPAEASTEEALSDREKILRSYAKAVVVDAVSKIEQMLKDGQFFKAGENIAKAENTLSQNRAMIAEPAYNKYIEQLKRMSREVEEGRHRWLGQWDDKKAWKLSK